MPTYVLDSTGALEGKSNSERPGIILERGRQALLCMCAGYFPNTCFKTFPDRLPGAGAGPKTQASRLRTQAQTQTQDDPSSGLRTQDSGPRAYSEAQAQSQGSGAGPRFRAQVQRQGSLQLMCSDLQNMCHPVLFKANPMRRGK